MKNFTVSSANFWLTRCVLESGVSTGRDTQHWRSSFLRSFSTRESTAQHLRDIVSYRQWLRRTGMEVDKFALDLLPAILKKAAKTPELGKVLQTHPLRTRNYSSSVEMSTAEAIKEYLEVRVSLPRLVPNGSYLVDIFCY